MWVVKFTKNAEKDQILIKRAGLEKKTKALLKLLCENPYSNPPEFKKLNGDFRGYYSRRINIKHRLIYRIDDENKLVVVHSMWSHYGDN